MRGHSDYDPMTALQKGQTVEEVMAAAKNSRAPKRQARRPMGEDRKCFLRLMGLGKWIK